MPVTKWLKSTFLKMLTLGKMDLAQEEKRNEKLSKVLMLLRLTSKKDWMLQQNIRVAKETIHHKIHTGDDCITDGFSMWLYVPQYKIDTSREPIEIHETWPYFFSLDHDKGFMTFNSSDDDVFCKGKIIGMINSETAIEEIDRDKAGIDADLLDFFDDLRICLRQK